jgi:hypothetical protein
MFFSSTLWFREFTLPFVFLKVKFEHICFRHACYISGQYQLDLTSKIIVVEGQRPFNFPERVFLLTTFEVYSYSLFSEESETKYDSY